MADDDGEWFDYSSCLNRQESSLDSDKDKGEGEKQQEVPGEESQSNTSDAERLENVFEVLKCSLRNDSDVSHVTAATCVHEIIPESEIKGPFEHRVWLNLLDKLNSIRQTKWSGSCLEGRYNHSLHVSRNTNPQDSSPVTVDNFANNWFNFHGMKTYVKLLNNDVSCEKNENMPNGIAELDSELVNKNDIRCNNKLTLLDSTDNTTSNPSSECDSTFEDLGPELEWADNDVKDDTLSSNLSSASGFDESEAAKDLARLSYEEILQLQNELQAYTKQYSDILVIELENRDAYIREKELKNEFISSFLAVQGKIREATITNNKKKFSLQSNPSSTSQSLMMTTIPYEIQNGGPGPEILEKLIEIMEAMKTNSPTVPTLLTDYILKVLCK